MVRDFKLTKAALADLMGVGRYTEATWGRAQRDRYLGMLDEAFRLVAEDSTRGVRCDEVRPGYRKHFVGRHVVYYRAEAETVWIVRILHERMDARTQFKGEQS